MDCSDGVCKLIAKLKLGVYRISNDFVLLEWTPRNAGPYKVEIKEPNAADWRVLVEASQNSFLKKKGLIAGQSYEFRVSNGKSQAEITVIPETSPPAPELHATAKDDGNLGVIVNWSSSSNASEYEVQLREMNGSLDWTTLSNQVKGNKLRANNRKPAPDYVARYRANVNGQWGCWSAPSAPKEVGNVNTTFSSLLGDTLLRGNEKVPINALAGKTVAVYFSAHWCPPCRQQTANMKEFYKFAQSQSYPFEVVFISADRDQHGFQTYFGEMPWLALPYESSRREQAMARFQVSGIPKLMIFGPSGNIISENAAGVPLTKELLDSWTR